MYARVESSESPFVDYFSQTTNTELKSYVSSWLEKKDMKNWGLNAVKACQPFILRTAIEENNLEIVKLLIENNCMHNDYACNNILTSAATYGCLDIVRYLVTAHKPLLDLPDMYEKAMSGGHFGTLQYLISNSGVEFVFAETLLLLDTIIENGYADVALLIMSQPHVIAQLEKCREDKHYYGLQEKMAELTQKTNEIKSSIPALVKHRNHSHFFFQCTMDSSGGLNPLNLQELRQSIAGIGLDLMQKDLAISDERLKNILSIPDARLKNILNILDLKDNMLFETDVISSSKNITMSLK